MSNLFWLWTWLAVIPFLLGIVVNLLMLKFKKSYFITLGVVIINIISWITVSNINTHGSEGPGLRCLQLSFFAVGMILVEILKFIYKRTRK